MVQGAVAPSFDKVVPQAAGQPQRRFGLLSARRRPKVQRIEGTMRKPEAATPLRASLVRPAWVMARGRHAFVPHPT